LIILGALVSLIKGEIGAAGGASIAEGAILMFDQMRLFNFFTFWIFS
jgi:hypothetical protein